MGVEVGVEVVSARENAQKEIQKVGVEEKGVEVAKFCPEVLKKQGVEVPIFEKC